MLIWWGVAIAPLVYLTFRRASIGLVLAYCFQMWLLHWLGALVHAFPWAELPETPTVALGFQQATFGFVAFAVGVLVFGSAVGKFILSKQSKGGASALDPKLPRKYILAGMVFYFVLAPTIGNYPGMNAVPAVGSQLVVVGCCLRCWLAWHLKGKAGLVRTLIPTMLIPAVILLRQGFLGFGVIAVATILIFTAQFFRPRWVLGVGFLVVAYVGMTGYITYMRDREDIRSAVWGKSSFSDRIATTWNSVKTFEWFSPHDDEQLTIIDARLNQNILIGAAVDHLAESGDFMRGATMRDAVLAMIPRLIWPDKPISAGSGLLVTNLTGIEFGFRTSVGIGPVLEFYGNFGTVGVLLGFLVVGAIIGGLDYSAGSQLEAGNWPVFMTTFLVGISCLNVSGSLVEITAGAAASVVVAKAVNRILAKQAAKTQQPVLQPAT